MRDLASRGLRRRPEAASISADLERLRSGMGSLALTADYKAFLAQFRSGRDNARRLMRGHMTHGPMRRFARDRQPLAHEPYSVTGRLSACSPPWPQGSSVSSLQKLAPPTNPAVGIV